MKKLIAILLAVLMCSSALIAVSAAEETEPAATVPAVAEAPRFVGAQYVDNGDGTHNVRFVSVINNLEGDRLGFEITAHFINEAGKGVAYKYPAEETEGVRVFEQIYDAGNLVSATNPKYNGAYFYVYVLEGVPTDYDVFFETTAYLVNGEEKLCADTEFVNFSNGETNPMTMGEKQTYDYVEKSTALSAFGIPGSYNASLNNNNNVSTGVNVVDGKLNIGNISWTTPSGQKSPNCMVKLVSPQTLANALKKNDNTYHNTYVFEMDLYFTPIADGTSNLYFIFNGEDGEWTTNKVNALASGFQHKTSYGNNVNRQQGGFNSATQSISPSGSTTVATVAACKLAFVVDGTVGRTDMFINGVWQCGTTITAGTAAGLKFNDANVLTSNIMLWVQNAPTKLDNIKIMVPDTANGAVTYTKDSNENITSATLNSLTTTYYEGFHDVEGTYGVDRPRSVNTTYDANTYITSEGKLAVQGTTWHNPYITVADSDAMNLNGTTTFIVDADINVTKLGTFSLFFDEPADVSNVTANNGAAVRIEKSDTDAIVWYRCFDSNNYGTPNDKKVTFKENANFTNLSFNIRIIVNGTTYSVYIDGNHCISAELPAAVVATNNTAFMLWAQNTDLTLDNLQITTLNAN